LYRRSSIIRISARLIAQPQINQEDRALSQEIPFDRTQAFVEGVAPHLAAIKAACTEHKIPFFFEFAVKNDETGTKYERGILAPKPIGLTLAENTILQHNLVARGFRAVPPGEIQEVDFDEAIGGTD
jgi:hypothetical protein